MIIENQLFDYVEAEALEVASTCYKKAWDDIRGQFNHPDHSDRVRSDLLREHAAIHAKRALPAFGFKWVWDEGQHLFVSKVILVFRIFDEFQNPHRPATQRGRRLYQSLLIEDLPTLFVGMLSNPPRTSYTGIYLCHPNQSGNGMAWTKDITHGITAADAVQDRLIELTDEPEKHIEKKSKPEKFKPKYDTSIGESSEEAGPGGNSAS
jgi:hypothetical protein